MKADIIKRVILFAFCLRYLNQLKPEEIIPFWKDQQQNQLSLLKSFHSKSPEIQIQLTKEEISTLNRLIKTSALTEKEYKLLKNRTNYIIASAINQTPYDYLIKNLDSYLHLYSNIDFADNYILNDFATDDLIGNFIRLSVYKEALNENCSSDRKDMSKYLAENNINVTKKVLKGEVLQKYLSDNMYNLMLTGHYEGFEKHN